MDAPLHLAGLNEALKPTAPTAPLITYVIPAHNEERTVADVVRQTQAAARPGERVVVVDSGSTDGTAAVARAAGVEVLEGLKGKGTAMQLAVDSTDSEWLVFIDADTNQCATNPAEVLGNAVRDVHSNEHVGQVLGEFHEATHSASGRPVVHTRLIGTYEPLQTSLFPENRGELGRFPLTGFRAVRRTALPRNLTSGFGVEAVINLRMAVTGKRTERVRIGHLEGTAKANPQMGGEIVDALLDAAMDAGRLHPSQRRAYEEWISRTSSVPKELGDTDTTYRERVADRAGPPPSRGIGVDHVEAADVETGHVQEETKPMALSGRFTRRDRYEEHIQLLTGLAQQTGDPTYSSYATRMERYLADDHIDACEAAVEGVTRYVGQRQEEVLPAMMEVLSQPGGLLAGGSVRGEALPNGYKVDAATLATELPPGEWDRIATSAQHAYWQESQPRDMSAARANAGTAVVVAGVPGAGKSTLLAGERFRDHVIYDTDIMDRGIMAGLAEGGHLQDLTPLGTEIYGITIPPHAMQRLVGGASRQVFDDFMENTVYPDRLPLAIHNPLCGPTYDGERKSLRPVIERGYQIEEVLNLNVPRDVARKRKNEQYLASAEHHEAWASQRDPDASLEDRTGGKWMSSAGYAAGFDTHGGTPSNIVYSAQLAREAQGGAPGLANMEVVMLDASGPEPKEVLRTQNPAEIKQFAQRWTQGPTAPAPHPIGIRLQGALPQISLDRPPPPAEEAPGYAR